MKTLFKKLELVATRVEREKGLYLLAVVHPVGGLHDRWDLLICSPELEPWSTDAMRYMAALLQDVLRVEDIVRIARIVVLPRDNDVVAALLSNDQIQPGKLTDPHDERFDRVFLVLPTPHDQQSAPMVGSRRQ
jgi:hypothetical protein